MSDRCGMLNPSNKVVLVQGGSPADVNFEGEAVSAFRCSECGYVSFNPPSNETLERFYNTTYPEHAKSWYNVENDFGEWKRRPRAQRIVDMAARFGFGAGSAFHEVGCAFGGTVFELQSRGIDASGTDLNASAIQEGMARGVTKVQAAFDTGFLRERSPKANVVYGYHVLEHVPNPLDYLSNLRSALAPESIVILLVPNGMALFPLLYGFTRYNWYAYPEHLHLFSPRSLVCLAKAAGFTLLHVATKPYAVEEEVRRKTVGPHGATPLDEALHNRMLSDSLMAEELEFVLTPAGGPIAERFQADALFAQRRARDNAVNEKELHAISETTPLANPYTV